MLELTVTPKELFDEETERFVNLPGANLEFEHSLVSLSKWESKYRKPFFSDKDEHKKTPYELLDYFYMMCLQKVDPNIIHFMNSDEINIIGDYIREDQTATWFSSSETPKGPSRKTMTSELVYYWLVALSIPFEVDKWHFNRMLTLIEVVNRENNPDNNKHSKGSMISQRRRLNAERRAKFGHGG